MIALAALLVLVALTLPHFLRLEGVRPQISAALWISNLTVRALLCVYAALFVVLYVPGTELYAVVSTWCWHTVVPVVATHLRLTGDNLRDVAVLGPLVILVSSAAWAGLNVFRAARSVRVLKRMIVGAGPGDSVVLRDGQILIAAAGLRRPQVVVSAGALVALDDDELAAGLEHERGHIAHRHRYLIVLAEVLAAIARFLPGTRSAHRELLFSLERDADQYALARDHHPTSLASAICKAAESTFATGPALAALGGGSVARRLHVLLDGPPATRCAGANVVALSCACALAGAALLAGLALPEAAHAGAHAAGSVAAGHFCPD